MSEVDYSLYYYRRKPQKSKAKSPRWGMLFAVLAIAGGFVAFILLFTTSRPGGTYLRVNEGGTCVEVLDAAWYAIDMGTRTTSAAAASYAQAIQARGGGGYVLEYGGSFRVLASLYKKKEDADSVATSLRGAGEECAVLELRVPQGRIGADTAGKPLTALYDVLNYVYTTMESLESIGYDLDTSKLDYSGLKTRLSALMSGRSAALKTLSNYESKIPHAPEIKTVLVKMEDSLDRISAAASTSAASVAVKYAQGAVLDSYLIMLNQIF